MAEKKTDLEDVLEHGIDVKNRRIFFGGSPEESKSDDDSGSDFTWQSVEIAVRAIKAMEGRSHQPIELYMSSNGGEVLEMMRLHDVIQSSPCQIIFYGSGKVCSAAAFIMAVCDERVLYPNTRILLHHGADAASGVYIDFMASAEESERESFITSKMLADNSRMPIEFWQDLLRHDVWLCPEEAIALGLADRIVEPKKRGNLRKVRIAQLNEPVDKKEMTKLVKTIYRRTRRSSLSSLEIKAPVEEFDPGIVVVPPGPIPADTPTVSPGSPSSAPNTGS